MTLVDFIDLEHDEWHVKVDVIDLSSDEDTVEKDGNVEEEDDDNVHQSENLAEAATSLPISDQDTPATASLSLVAHGSAMSSLMTEKSMQPENQEFHATSDVTKEATQPGNHELIAAGDSVGEAMQSEREAGVFSSMTEQAVVTSLLLAKQSAITSSLKKDKSMQSGNQMFVAALDCAEDDDNVPQSENLAEAATSLVTSKQDATATTSQGGTTMYGKVCSSGSNGCRIQGCTNSEHGGTHLCIIHNSRPHIRCCAVIGCTNRACTEIGGRTGCCVKHGGGRRCKYDSCGKGAKGKTDYCIAHGGGRRCKFQSEIRAKAVGLPSMTERGATCKSHHVDQLCQMIGYPHIVGDGNNSDHEMLPALAHQAKKSEPSKRRNSHSVIGGRSQKRQNTNDYDWREKGQNFRLSEQYAESTANNPQLASTSPTTVSKS